MCVTLAKFHKIPLQLSRGQTSGVGIVYGQMDVGGQPLSPDRPRGMCGYESHTYTKYIICHQYRKTSRIEAHLIFISFALDHIMEVRFDQQLSPHRKLSYFHDKIHVIY